MDRAGLRTVKAADSGNGQLVQTPDPDHKCDERLGPDPTSGRRRRRRRNRGWRREVDRHSGGDGRHHPSISPCPEAGPPQGRLSPE